MTTKTFGNLAIFVFVSLFALAGVIGCNPSDVLPGANPRGSLDEKIETGLKNSDLLVRQAWSMIRDRVEMWETSSKEIFGDKATEFTDAEITTLKMVARLDDAGKDPNVEVYSLRFRMRPKDPSKLMLAGGSTIEGGWLLSQSSMGDPYLVARTSAAEVTYLGTVYSEQGVVDAAFELLYRLEVTSDPSLVATSPIEVTRTFAVPSAGLTPEAAAELFAARFMDALREDEPDLADPQYKTFVVTDYQLTGVKVYPTIKAPAEYRLGESETGEESWIVEPAVSFEYEGTAGSAGLDHKGKLVGFLMTKDGDNYTFRSRFGSME